MSNFTLFIVSGKIDRVGPLHGRSKFSSELVWRSWRLRYGFDTNWSLQGLTFRPARG